MKAQRLCGVTRVWSDDDPTGLGLTAPDLDVNIIPNPRMTLAVASMGDLYLI
ncbi:hypothetical protein SynMITS9220_01745 [Synechococcus sp. MIT S9220]|nr:hypothetical protein SynMITS9220_01745 [Synechococcus sp. MIT S9220]